jgi:hypothetical protein
MSLSKIFAHAICVDVQQAFSSHWKQVRRCLSLYLSSVIPEESYMRTDSPWNLSDIILSNERKFRRASKSLRAAATTLLANEWPRRLWWMGG